MFYFSKKMLIILKSLDDGHKSVVIAAIRTRLKCPEKYKLLTMMFGYFGFHRLYLKDVQGTWVRINYLLAAGIAAGAGVFLSSFQLLGLSTVLVSITLAMWVFDLLTPQLALKRYHSKVESRVVQWHASQQKKR